MMTARSFGNYDLPNALADLIDNSITAKAKKVLLTCLYNSGDPLVSILDDGQGMTEEKLHAAMRPASTNPAEERSIDDLGRFGWGLKSASFSQCKKLTVISKTEGNISGALWDLDDIALWKMGVLSKEEIEKLTSQIPLKESGTAIFWNSCDRLSEGGHLKEQEFNELISHTRIKLALIFHKFLAGEVRGKKLVIELNGQSIQPFDPFHKENNATWPGEVEEINISGRGKIRIEPFILPHFSKLALADYDRLGGEEGFVRNQGFYVYRNHRLIINGTWFRLVKHGELSQLVRISVDIPNTLDDLWKITLDKSDAQLPTALRVRLKDIVEGLKNNSSRVFKSKGGRINTPGHIPVWSKYARGGEIRYYINREHPVIGALISTGEAGRSDAYTTALGLIEQAFPVTTFGEDAIKTPNAFHQTESDPRRFIASLEAALPMLLVNENGNINALVQKLRITEPYNHNWNIVEEHLRQKGWLHKKVG
jgi:hypothetical protein